jgi:hypothetical protein
MLPSVIGPIGSSERGIGRHSISGRDVRESAWGVEERPYLEGLSPFIIDTMPKQSVMVKLIVSNGSHGWRSSHIGESRCSLWIWERYATFVSGLEVSLPPGSRDPHLHNFDHLAASMHELGHHPRCRGAIRRIRFPVSNFAQTAIDQWGIKIRGA